MYMFGPAHNGTNRAETILGPATVGSIHLRRVYKDWAPICCDTPQVVVGNLGYSMISRGAFFTPNIAAFNLPGGSRAWRKLIGGGPSGGNNDVPAVSNGSLFLNGAAFDAATGRPLWGTALGVEDAIDTVSNGVVYEDVANLLTARNASTGQLIWSATVPGTCCSFGAVTVADGLAYAVSNRLVAYNATSGKRVFMSSVTDIFGTAAVSGGVAYVEGGSHLSAFNAATGALIWSSRTQNTNSISGTAVAVDGTTAVVGTPQFLIAFDTTSGKRLWTINGGPVASYLEPAVANGVVYAGSLGIGLQAVDEKSGRILFTHKSFCLGAIVSRGTVYDDCGGNMTAFGL
jgi:outer membrane protein assembly factor BamB